MIVKYRRLYDELLTVQKTVRTVYPFKARNTILDLISRGFRPEVYSPGAVGPTRGHKLDWWDLVTVGIIDSLLRSGVQYEDIMLGKKKSQSSCPIQFEKFGEEGERRFEAFDSWEKRQIQGYLDDRKSAVVVFVVFRRSLSWAFFSEQAASDRKKRASQVEEVVSDIYFVREEHEDYFWDRIRSVGGQDTLERVTCIRCQYWHRFVDDRLRQRG